MHDGWVLMTLRDAGISLIDCVHKTPSPVETGYSYVTIPEMQQGRLNLTEARKICWEDFVEWTRKAAPQAYDVVLSRRCNPGETAFVRPSDEFALGQNLVLLRASGSHVYPPFLRWLVRSPAWWDQIRTFLNAGAVFDSLKCADVPSFELPIPPLSDQRGIACVLGALDDKIELNRRMNRTLERLARAIFEDWLERTAGSASTRLVHDLIDSGLLAVNDGYRAKRIELRVQGLPFARAGNLLDSGFDFADAELLGSEGIAAAREKVSVPLDAVFTSKGTVGRIAQVTAHTPRFVYAPQLCFWRALDREAIDPHVLYQWMHSSEFRMQIDALKGQTDMADYVSLRDQRNMEITLPATNQQREIAPKLAALRDLIANNAAESGTLGALRDLLLPKLLSGEIRVKDAEKCVGGAA